MKKEKNNYIDSRTPKERKADSEIESITTIIDEFNKKCELKIKEKTKLLAQDIFLVFFVLALSGVFALLFVWFMFEVLIIIRALGK